MDFELFLRESIDIKEEPVHETDDRNCVSENHQFYPISRMSPNCAEKSARSFRKEETIQHCLKTRDRNLCRPISYQCKECSRTFTTKGNLQQHLIKTHGQERPFICELCGSSFKRKQQLEFHMRTHDGTAPFQCETCEKSFKFKQQLQNHELTHYNIKTLACNDCGKSFKLRQHLDKHKLTHTGVKDYNCDYCKKSFMFKQQLEVHIKIHLNIKEYKCRFCTKEFRTKQQLQTHLKKHTEIKTKWDDS